MHQQIEELNENTEELSIKEQCWAEIEAVLNKYDCSLTGEGIYYDSETGDEHSCSADDFGVVSNSYIRRIDQYWKDLARHREEQARLDAKNKYNELKKNYSKYKDLKIFKVGKTSVSSFWFENLYVNPKYNFKKQSLFSWNPNQYWSYSMKGSKHLPVYLSIDKHSDYFGYNGEPHFTTMYWHIDIEEGYRKKEFTEWFKFRKNVPAENYQDMIDVCKIIDQLVDAGVLYFEIK